MSWYQLLMIWLDINAVIGVWIYGRFGWKGLIDLRQSLVERLMRGVNGK